MGVPGRAENPTVCRAGRGEGGGVDRGPLFDAMVVAVIRFTGKFQTCDTVFAPVNGNRCCVSFCLDDTPIRLYATDAFYECISRQNPTS